MKQQRRSRVLWFAAASALLTTFTVCAAGYPSKPLRWVVPFPPGGTMDQVVRTVIQGMQGDFPQPIIVENKPGAGTRIAVEQVARAKPDGYTIVTVANSFTINPSLYSQLPYDTENDFTAVALLSATPNILVGNTTVKANTLEELITLAKAQPGTLTYASFGTGTSAHLAGEWLKEVGGFDMLHVPYKGAVPATTDLLGGQVDLMMHNLPDVLPHLETGRLKAFGVTSTQRARLAPDIPTIAEQGFKDFETNSWYGVLAPAGTPAEVVTYLNEAINKALNRPDIKEALAKSGFDVSPGPPAQLAQLIANDLQKNARLVKNAQIKIE